MGFLGGFFWVFYCQPWFKDHVAYTMAKYGMSMCVLGMAEEFKKVITSLFNPFFPVSLIYLSERCLTSQTSLESGSSKSTVSSKFLL